VRYSRSLDGMRVSVEMSAKGGKRTSAVRV
jgi:hypothetical protein